MAKPRLPTVQTHSRPMRSEIWPSAICPGMPNRLTRPERPRRDRRAEADLDQVLGLVHLHRVPGVEAAEDTRGDPPEAGGAHGARQGPVDRRPGRVRRHCDALRRRPTPLGAASPSGCSPMSSGRRRSSRLSGASTTSSNSAQWPAGGTPAGAVDDQLHPRQQHDRADADARKGDADRQPAPAHEPVGQEQRLPGVAQADAAAADQHAERQVEMPRRASTAAPAADPHAIRPRRAPSRARAVAVHQRPSVGLRAAETTKPNENAPAVTPRSQPNSVEDRRKQQRESGTRVDADAHRDKGDGDDDPAVEEWEAHGQYRLPAVARFKREACSALSLRRAPVAAIDAAWPSSINEGRPCCDVIDTLRRTQHKARL